MFDFVMNKVARSSVTNNTLTSLERKYRFRFPKLLRDYYTRYDGSEIKCCEFQKNENIFYVTDIIEFEENIIKESFDEKNELKGYIYFATGYEEFYYWESSTERVYCSSPAIDENLIPICNSIEEFFEILNNNSEEKIKGIEEIKPTNNQKKISSSSQKKIDVKKIIKQMLIWMLVLYLMVIKNYYL